MSLLFSSSLHLSPSSTPAATSIRYRLIPPRTAAFSSSPPAGGLFSVSGTSQSPFPDDHILRGPLYCSSSSSMSLEESTSAHQLEDSLLYSRAFWISKYSIAWNVEVGSGSCYLFASKMATLRVEDGYDVKIKLEKDHGPLPENVVKKFPHIQNYSPFTVPHASDVETLLKCQLAVANFNSYGQCNNITCLQLPGVLDDLFSYEGPLGAVYLKEAVSLYLWAPTAQAVQAQIYRDPVGGMPFEVIQLEEFDGVWRTKGPKSWEGCYYEYEVTVYHPSTLRVEKCFTSDPYARGISSDARRTLFVDLGSDDLKPEGWDKLADEKPPLHSFSDISIYELHIRDFSINDQSVHPDLRGGYMAFTLQDSAGITHLKKLSSAGISHVHLLPTFQFAGVDDDKTKWKSLGKCIYLIGLLSLFSLNPIYSICLTLQPNDHDHGTDEVAEFMLAVSRDHIQVGMAANLRDYVLTNFEGNEVKGSEVLTHDGSPVAYASCPTETVNYVSAHDNETLFDIVSLKTPRNITVNDRCRINHLATSIIALSQGIPLFHCGDELLRSKSMDRDSYNSGDWFNRLDFTYMTNNWGVGLPPKEKNENNWPLIKPRLANPSFKPSKSHILTAVENFTNLLQIRYSSPLFRLKTANAIQERVRFHNTGASLIPGVIVMSIEDGHKGIPGLSQLDPIYSYIVVVVNARPTEISFPCPALRARTLQLHPIQVMSTDPIVKNSTYEPSTGCFMVPSRTTSVFVEPRMHE
ncbi:pullulanase 1, chloroplastic [Momordica charantia]|uniref:Pullulanase 1, chloroplastic n=1 Tax=Momordica charantia TaxID=3673 RepID=A0A6J1CC10_MOMCH|nr:pullulanase 1, chloroplastic [Momordica charantia]